MFQRNQWIFTSSSRSRTSDPISYQLETMDLLSGSPRSCLVNSLPPGICLRKWYLNLCGFRIQKKKHTTTPGSEQPSCPLRFSWKKCHKTMGPWAISNHPHEIDNNNRRHERPAAEEPEEWLKILIAWILQRSKSIATKIRHVRLWQYGKKHRVAG